MDQASCSYDEDKYDNLTPGTSKGAALINPTIENFKKALNYGPMGIEIAADWDKFTHYSSGIIKSKDCGVDPDHAVTAVGYGVENGDEYILIKNSWDTDWGENGYVRILLSTEYSDQGICGTLNLGVMANNLIE